MDTALPPPRLGASPLDHARALAPGFATRAPLHDLDGSVPFENLGALREAGLLALTVPRGFGGTPIALDEAATLVGIVAEACPATALILAMQLIHVRAVLGNPAIAHTLRQRLANSVLERGELLNALRVEPDLGTPARGGLPATLARRTAAGWSLSGRKIYSTGSPALHWGLVFARTDEPTPRTGLFLVPMRDLATQGSVQIVETWDGTGLRASGSHDVLLHEVALPPDHALELRDPAGWAANDPSEVAWNTLLVAALYTGIARAARDWLLGFLRGRIPANLGQPLATLPRMQDAVGRIEARLATNDALIRDGARHRHTGPGLALLKTVAAQNAIDAVQDAVALCGNPALSRANPLERHLRDVLCSRIHTPQPDAAFLAAGRAALLPA